jgi:hypothetical protein
MEISPTFCHEATTGHHALASGWWRPRTGSPEPRYISQGDILPSHQGSPVVWVLIAEVQPSHADLVFSYTTRHMKEALA